MNAVVTYIFGKGQEILREPLVVDPGVEYICVTDQSFLTSEHWRIVVDDLPQAKCTRDKMPLVKYNPFKYTQAECIIVMDGAMQITHSLNNTFTQLNNIPLLIKPHPERDNLYDELNTWAEKRGLPVNTITKFAVMSSIDNIDLRKKFLTESCILGYRNTPEIRKLCACVLAYMQFLGDGGKLCVTNQCPLTYLIEKMEIPFNLIKQQSIVQRFNHNSWQKIDR